MTSPSPRGRPAIIAGRFTIQRKLGSGSMGTVYLAQDAALNRLVALKLLRTESLIAGAVERLQQEFRTVASLRHRQIATAYDFG